MNNHEQMVPLNMFKTTLPVSQLLGIMLFPQKPIQQENLLKQMEGHVSRTLLDDFGHLEGDARSFFEQQMGEREITILKSTPMTKDSFVTKKQFENASLSGAVSGLILDFLLRASVSNPKHFSKAKAVHWAQNWVQETQGIKKDEKYLRDAWRSHSCVSHLWAAFGPDGIRAIDTNRPHESMIVGLAIAEGFRERAENLSLNDSNGPISLEGTMIPTLGLPEEDIEDGRFRAKIMSACLSKEQMNSCKRYRRVKR